MRTNGRAFGSRAKRGFAGLVAAATLGFAAALSPASAQTQETYLVTVDQAFVVRLLNPVAAIVIGNPTIADATILDNMDPGDHRAQLWDHQSDRTEHFGRRHH